MTALAFCTILARNYLPKALTLSESLQRFDSPHPLTIFLIDATEDTELPEIDGVRWMHPGHLDLPGRSALELPMSYDLVEFATAVKPLVLQSLLREHEQVAYLDPDTYQTSPMVELSPALDASAGGIVLTPHYMTPTSQGGEFSEGHLLHVGVYNLGFCAVSRKADDFLIWWWDHLATECLHDPIAGLFVDQKWMDVGSVLWQASSLRHYGYNVSVANLHERPVERDADGYYISSSGDRLRLFHFHAFDPDRPDELSTRLEGTAHYRADSEALDTLCKEYAATVLDKRAMLGPQPDYVYNTDTTGRRIPRRLRHAYRAAIQSGADVPSPFVAAEAAAYEKWRRSAWRLTGRLMVSDVAKGVRYALPEEFETVKRRVPGLTRRFRDRYVEKTGMWG